MPTGAEIINGTLRPLKLKVGNDSVFTEVTILQPEGSYKVLLDPHRTYQEFILSDRSGKLMLIITSDQCADNRKITVVEADGSFKTIKEPKRPQSTSWIVKLLSFVKS